MVVFAHREYDLIEVGIVRQSRFDINDVVAFLSIYGVFRSSRIRASSWENSKIGLLDVGIHNQLALHVEKANMLKELTTFQYWINQQAFFIDSLDEVSNKKTSLLDRADEEAIMLRSDYSIDDEIKWRLQYVFACGIYAFSFPEKMAANLANLGMCNILSPSEKTVSTARKLIRYLNEDRVFVSEEFKSELLGLIEGGHAVDPFETKVKVSDQQRRKYTIFQLSRVGQEELLSRNAKKGRFYPKIVANIMSLLDCDSELRTIEYIMAPFDLEVYLALDSNDQYDQDSGKFRYSDWELVSILHNI